MVRENLEYFNESRPHQGIDQYVRCGPPIPDKPDSSKIIAFPVLNGLHNEHVCAL